LWIGRLAPEATSNTPPQPSVVLIRKRSVSWPAPANLPCSSEFTIVVGVDRFWKKLATPVRTGCGVTFT